MLHCEDSELEELSLLWIFLAGDAGDSIVVDVVGPVSDGVGRFLRVCLAGSFGPEPVGSSGPELEGAFLILELRVCII